jgi:transglutaminase-like putative cysteine protease
LPVRWRTAALDDYDGRRWTPVVTLRPIGATLGTVTGSTISADVRFLDDDLRLVPLPGSPVRVDAAVETDRDRTVVRLVDRPEPGDSVSIVSNVAPTAESVGSEVTIRSRPVDENVAGLTGLAESLAAEGPDGADATIVAQLATIEGTLREDFILDSDVTGGGLQRKLIDRFLRDTQRGNTEQFATAYVLLARSLGVDARVATGFVVDEPAASPLALTSEDAVIWPEVALSDGTWIAFDPVPDEEATDATPPDPQPQVQTPAAPQPPIAPPPETADEAPDTDDDTTDVDSGTLSSAELWATRAAVAVGIVVLPLVIGVAVVLGVKYRRRRRRRHADEPTDRIRGAWASATDGLVDAGLTIPPSLTDDEIARRGRPVAPTAHRELQRLAVLNSAATYGSPNRPDLLASDAFRCLDAIDKAIKLPKSRWRRVTWRLSLRSLRPTTRSPVA